MCSSEYLFLSIYSFYIRFCIPWKERVIEFVTQFNSRLRDSVRYGDQYCRSPSGTGLVVESLLVVRCICNTLVERIERDYHRVYRGYDRL